jgi:ribonuclease BN (tRNA processing enzyme)
MNIIHKIKIYPVDNADTTLIKMDDKSTILIDCQIRACEENSNGITVYDVKKDLLEEIQKDSANNPFIDLFVLSHPHKDHCLGFGNNFYCGNPDEYVKSNRDKNEIIIGELWVTQMVFSNDICEEAEPIRKEAKRRKKLFEENPSVANQQGNRLRIIGYNDQDITVDGLHYVPGNTITAINGKTSDLCSFFIHAPFKSDLVQGKAEKDHNSTSIVFQISFRTEKVGEIKAKVVFGGDADHYVWEKVLEKSEKNNNQDKLEWDIFLCPHHCSWTFFNDTPYEDNVDPKDYSLKFLDYRLEDANVVASSVKIEDNDINPPHYSAKEQYENKVGKANFRNTSINESETAPKPLIYLIDSSGIKLSKTLVSVTTGILSNNTPRAGIF